MAEDNNSSIEVGDSSEVVAFFTTGNQYYVSARYAACAGFVPVYGNLFHHAVEMYLKAALLRFTERSRRGHNLKKLWAELKLSVSDPALGRFDNCIKELDKFEDIRYPDKVLKMGMIGGARWEKEDPNAGKSFMGKSGPFTLSPGQSLVIALPAHSRYEISIYEIDELVMAIYAAASMNPQLIEMQMFPGVAKEYLHHRNKSLPGR